jgi:hypothetical protein
LQALHKKSRDLINIEKNHIDGVFIGDIAKHVQTLFNGIIKFNITLVYPTCTYHGHLVWINHNDLSVSIEHKNKIYNLNVPP